MVKAKVEESPEAAQFEQERKPGQKYPTPSLGYADRVFYETLYRQKPSSEMAQDWVLAYGVLPVKEAEKLHKSVCKRKGVKAEVASPARKAAKPAAKKAKTSRSAKGKVIDDDDADTGFEASGCFEGVGATAM